jgi:hypothetical protein
MKWPTWLYTCTHTSNVTLTFTQLVYLIPYPHAICLNQVIFGNCNLFYLQNFKRCGLSTLVVKIWTTWKLLNILDILCNIVVIPKWSGGTEIVSMKLWACDHIWATWTCRFIILLGADIQKISHLLKMWSTILLISWTNSAEHFAKDHITELIGSWYILRFWRMKFCKRFHMLLLHDHSGRMVVPGPFQKQFRNNYLIFKPTYFITIFFITIS